MAYNGNWYFYDRSNGNFTTANMHNTGMPLKVGDGDNSSVYAVKVIVDPTKGTYDAQIDRLASDGTRQRVVAADTLTFRNNQTTASAGPVGVDWLLFGANASSTSNNLSYSLDSLCVTGRNYIWAGFDDGRINPAQDTAIDTFDASANGIGGGGWGARWAVVGNAGDATVMMPGDTGFAPLEGP